MSFPTKSITDLKKTEKSRLSVAVLDFNNLTGDEKLNYLSGTIAKTISTYLGSSDLFEVQEKREFQSAIGEEESKLPSISQIGKKFVLDVIVIGSHIYNDGNIRLNLKQVDVKKTGTDAATAEKR